MVTNLVCVIEEFCYNIQSLSFRAETSEIMQFPPKNIYTLISKRQFAL